MPLRAFSFPAMGTYEVTTDGENIVGPVTLDQIRRGLVAGKIPADAQAREAGSSEWVPLAIILATAPPAEPTALAGEASPPTPTPAKRSATTGGFTSAGVIIGGGVLVLLVLLGINLSWTDDSVPKQPKKLTPQEEASAKQKAAQDEARRKAEVEAQRVRAKREEEERAERVKRLRSKVKRKYWDDEPDGECTGKGLPPYRYSYEGGTYAEDEEVAVADGCRKLHGTVELQDYCCPTKPLRF